MWLAWQVLEILAIYLGQGGQMSNQFVRTATKPTTAANMHRYECQDQFQRHERFSVLVQSQSQDAREIARTKAAKRLGMVRDAILVRYTGTITTYVKRKDD